MTSACIHTVVYRVKGLYTDYVRTCKTLKLLLSQESVLYEEIKSNFNFGLSNKEQECMITSLEKNIGDGPR